MAQAKVAGTPAADGGVSGSQPRTPEGDHLVVSELVSDRPAAPSPFGDDQSFPLPVERLTYRPSTAS
ncbi:hypothetical protein EV385_3517 [Krasilnikovia cinnamomea]|uniref:Uncharacterized protein n=1 Tax=Krasilnikovia cinnamomea TaxID=349313 RepID=A0A4Q7ZM37_9ACTN|nr:hypothetical protein [Krasilnikovia cinnamomea]RZU51684.1 hypothetical protein EV385_3517 [Krasilnikovia cinnamomea]